MFMLEDPFDVLLSAESYRPFQYPIFGENPQKYQLEGKSYQEPYGMNSLSTLAETHEPNSYQESQAEHLAKGSQSDLHNCPKHLIKHIVRCLGFPTSTIIRATAFQLIQDSTKECLMNLLGILELCVKGKIKSLSKEVLKLIFEEGSELSPKLKLLQNPSIKKVFESSNQYQISKAKSLLRSFVAKKLEESRKDYVDYSSVLRKSINQRYQELFLRELRSGKISQRVSKQDKQWILQHRIG